MTVLVNPRRNRPLDRSRTFAGMGIFKQYDLRIRNGGDDAIDAVQDLIEAHEAEIALLKAEVAVLRAQLEQRDTHRPDIRT